MIDIESVESGDCEAMEYDEAVGLTLRASQPLTASHR